MKNKKIIILLSAFILTAETCFAVYGVPDVPDPVYNPDTAICFDASGKESPCHPAVSPLVNSKENTSLDNIPENISKLFQYLTTNTIRIKNDLIEGFQNIYDGLRDWVKTF